MLTNMNKHSPYFDLEHFNSFIRDKKNNFTILSTNIESIHSKINDLTIFVEQLREINFEFSAICLQECWITNTNTNLSHLHINGYTCISQLSNIGRKGGLITFLNDNFTYRIITHNNTSLNWESQFLEISGNGLNKKTLIGNIYRPPRDLQDNLRSFIDEFSTILSSHDYNNYEIFLCGDYNINLLKINENEINADFLEMLTSHSFFPKITLPTRFSRMNASLIDNIYCRISNNTLSSSAGILLKQFSDHQPCFLFVDSITTEIATPKTVRIQTNSAEALAKLSNELYEQNITTQISTNPFSNPNTTYDKVLSIIDNARLKHTPSKIVKFHRHKHKKQEWITKGILKSIKYRDKLYKQIKITDRNSISYNTHKTNLSTYNRILKQSIRIAKNIYYSSCFQRYKNDIKKTWATISNIMNKKVNKSEYPEFFEIDGNKVYDKKEIANKFNSYFTNIGPKLAHDIHDVNGKHFENFSTNKPDCELHFDQISVSDVNKIIDNLSSKTSCGFDDISLKLLKFLKPVLATPITIIINQMLNTGIFPYKLKVAKIKPLYKKGDTSNFNNYRPISLLPSISKIFEKVIFQQTYSYFEQNNLLYTSQYGFRKGHSTEYAALELADRIIQQMDENKTPINIYLDLSKAFDTLNHSILIHKLKFYGINGTAIHLFKSYLSNRKQYVEYENNTSDTLLITTGVPQGSVLGPLLFIIYLNDIAKSSDIFDFICYADDTTLSSVLNYFGNSQSSSDNINIELKKVYDWLKVNKLSLNISKTKFIIFHSPQQNVTIPLLYVDNTYIECVKNFNFLGIYFNQHMSWKYHINHIAKNISKSNGILNRLKSLLPTHVKVMIYNALILSKINYGILTWGYESESILKLQKKAVRIIALANYNAHTEPIFKKLSILKIHDLFSICQLKLYHNYLNELLPHHFINMNFKMNNEVHHYSTRISTKLHVSKVKHSFAKRCIRYSLPNLINQSPSCITDKLFTHSLKGLSNYAKHHALTKYSNECNVLNCYICR